MSQPETGDEWVLLSTAIAGMGELHHDYRLYPGLARRDVERAIRADRLKLRGDDWKKEKVPISGPITAQHDLDLVYNNLSERKPGPSPLNRQVLFRNVEVEWISTANYLREFLLSDRPILASAKGIKSIRANLKPPTATKNTVGFRPKIKTGPKSARKLDATKEAIRTKIRSGALSVEDLKKMLEKEMQSIFGVSRDTCRKARKAVLDESEFVEN